MYIKFLIKIFTLLALYQFPLSAHANIINQNFTYFHEKQTLDCSKNIIQFIEKKSYTKAETHIKNCAPNDQPTMQKLIAWSKLKDKKYSKNLDEDIKFLLENHDFYFMNKIKKYFIMRNYPVLTMRQIELIQTKYTDFDYWEKFLISTILDNHSDALSHKYVIESFREMDTSISLKAFESVINNNRDVLTDDMLRKKLYYFLIKKKIPYAQLINKILYNSETQAIDFIKNFNEKNHNQLKSYYQLPIKLQKNPAVLYHILKYLELKNAEKTITQLLLNHQIPKEYSNLFWKFRFRNTKYLLQYKKYHLSYKICLDNQVQPDDKYYAEASWTCGWIALTAQNSPNIAYEYFKKMLSISDNPRDISKASYWLGYTTEVIKPKESKEWYRKSMKYPYTYYGQLAYFKSDEVYQLPEDIYNNIFRIKSNKYLRSLINSNEMISLAYLFISHNRPKESVQFLKQAIKTAKNDTIITQILGLAAKTADIQYLHRISNLAYQYNVVIPDFYYPVIQHLKDDELINLVMSIIKQESAFQPEIIGKAGEIGLMQIMHKTAQTLSNSLSLPFFSDKLKDPLFNITLGYEYLRSLLQQFDNSYLLAIISYNAGPTNVRKWIKRFGDPRKLTEMSDIINWIEQIPFYITRDYAQKIFESLVVYQYLFYNTSEKMSRLYLKY